jgi:hypothetical protein
MPHAHEDFEFTPIEPRLWQGRYKRPEGEESAYHVSIDNRIEVRWRDGNDYLTCPVEMTPAASRMAQGVNAVKIQRTSMAGGAFVINEFGQVICPVQNSRNRFLVGVASGCLRFEDPDRQGVYRCIGDDEGQHSGDVWNLPYLGMQYQLAAGGWIYFWREGDDRAGSEKPLHQDTTLIGRLRAIRPHGAVRFIVNQHGIVLTKKLVDGSNWKAIYVGRINPHLWFQREE